MVALPDPREGDPFNQYISDFVRSREGPYAIQWPGGEWSTRDKPVSDPLVRAHLEGKYWVATRAPWYPRFVYADVDCPSEDTIDRVVSALKLSWGEYIIFTSPSWKETGNVHIAFCPRYNGDPPTKKLLRTILEPPLRDVSSELYPQENRLFRLPLGRDQHIIDEELGCPLPQSWESALYWIGKLGEYDMERIPRQTEIPFQREGPGRWSRKAEAEAFLAEGLQSFRTRHDACLCLSTYFFRMNLDPDDTRNRIRRWIRAKHNGFSQSINRGFWWLVDKEIEEEVSWTYAKYDWQRFWPDSTHNLEGWIAKDDLLWIGQVFPGDVRNQRKLFKLLSYYRPRQHHDWVFAGWRHWRSIGGWDSYQVFRTRLENASLLRVKNYRHVEGAPGLSYPRSFKLAVPYAGEEKMIHDDGRAIQDYSEALRAMFASTREVIEALRLERTTAWRALQNSTT